MAYRIDDLIAGFAQYTGSECQRVVEVLKRQKAAGIERMSLGTWAPGHPSSVEELAKGISDLYEAIEATPTCEHELVVRHRSATFPGITTRECTKCGMSTTSRDDPAKGNADMTPALLTAAQMRTPTT